MLALFLAGAGGSMMGTGASQNLTLLWFAGVVLIIAAFVIVRDYD